jgi:hypothetical protein
MDVTQLLFARGIEELECLGGLGGYKLVNVAQLMDVPKKHNL